MSAPACRAVLVEQGLPRDLVGTHRWLLTRLAGRWPDVPWQVREELAQDAWVALLQYREPVRRPVAFLARTASWAASDWCRMAGRRRGAVPLDENVDLAPHLDPFARLDGWRVSLLLAQAPAGVRQIVEHLYFEDGEIREYTQLWGCTEGAAHQRHSAALAWLRNAAGIPQVPTRARAALREEIERRRARVVAYFRAHPGWQRTSVVRRELVRDLAATREQVINDLLVLTQDGVLESRVPNRCRARSECRLREGS
jgi:DNA-directed RNA polymerase specialized sigma24 family protein